MRTIRCIFVGGSLCGYEIHIPRHANDYTADTGEIYFRSELRDSENRQVLRLKLGRCTYDLPKQKEQNHFPET